MGFHTNSAFYMLENHLEFLVSNKIPHFHSRFMALGAGQGDMGSVVCLQNAGTFSQAQSHEAKKQPTYTCPIRFVRSHTKQQALEIVEDLGFYVYLHCLYIRLLHTEIQGLKVQRDISMIPLCGTASVMRIETEEFIKGFDSAEDDRWYRLKL